MAQVHIEIPHEHQAFRRTLHNIVSSASPEQLYYALNSEHSPLHSQFLHFLAFSYAEWLVQQPNVDVEKAQQEWKDALSPKNGTYQRPMNGFVSVGLDDVKTPDSDDSSDLGDVIVTHPLGNANEIDDDDDLSTPPGSMNNHHIEDFDHDKYIMTAKGLRIRMKEKDPWQHVMPIYDQFFPMRKRGSGIDLSDTQEATGNMDAFSKLPKEKMNLIKSKLPLLADTRQVDQREELMCRKLELCRVVFDFNYTSVAEIKAIDKKKTYLTEILEYVARFNWYSEKVLRQCFVTIAANLFRALPSPARAEDETEPFEDKAWPHLQLVYDLTLRLVICTDVDKKIMRKYLEGDFVANIIELFASDDHREREYLKTILHRIYGRFMPLRGVIRQSISNCCFRTVYTQTRSANGIAEFLEIFCSIIHGFSIPVKEEHKEFLRNVLVPLHKCRKLEKFHEQLVACCVQFVFKDPSVAPVILGGLLRFWPTQSPIKEEMFITELINIISALLNHKNGFEWIDYKGILMQVIDKVVECMTCGHHQVAERAVALWMEESMEQLCDQDRDAIWMRLAAAFEKNKDHWNVNLRQTNDEVLEHVRNRDPEGFSKYEQKVLDRYQSSSASESRDEVVDSIIESVQERKLRKQASRAPRELQWAKLVEQKMILDEQKRLQEDVKKEIYSPRRASQAELVELISESMRQQNLDDDDDKDFEDDEDDIDQKEVSIPKMNGYHDSNSSTNSNGSLSVPQSLAVRTDDLQQSGSSGDESGSDKASPKKRRAISPASVKRKSSPSRPTRRDGDGAAPRDDESDHPRRKSPLRDTSSSSSDAPDSPTRRTGRSRVSKSHNQRSMAKSPGRARQKKGGQRSSSDRPSTNNSGTKSRQSRPAKSRSARSLRVKSGSSSGGGYVE